MAAVHVMIGFKVVTCFGGTRWDGLYLEEIQDRTGQSIKVRLKGVEKAVMRLLR